MLTQLAISQLTGYYTIDLIDGPVYIDSISGLGIPDPRTTTYDIPFDHGSVFISQYYTGRRIQIAGWVLGSSIAEYAANRQALAKAFTFDNELKTLKITNDIGQVFVAEVSVGSALQLIPEAGQLTACRFELTLLAPDGILYSEAASVVSAGVTVLSAGFAIPTAIPIDLSSSISSNALIITNAGTADIYPDLIRIIGPGTNFTIENRTTGDVLQLNTTLSSVQIATINAKRKTATRDDGTNLYEYMTGSLKLAPGTNTLTLAVGSGSTSATTLEVTARSGYFGI